MKLTEKIQTLFSLYKEQILYLFFGVITTIVSFFVYFLSVYQLHLGVFWANIWSWLISVAVAFFTNKKYVFVHASKEKSVVGEVLSFYAARLFSLALETIFLLVTVVNFGISDVLMKPLASVIVVIVNYITSRFIVFKK